MDFHFKYHYTIGISPSHSDGITSQISDKIRAKLNFPTGTLLKTVGNIPDEANDNTFSPYAGQNSTKSDSLNKCALFYELNQTTYFDNITLLSTRTNNFYLSPNNSIPLSSTKPTTTLR